MPKLTRLWESLAPQTLPRHWSRRRWCGQSTGRAALRSLGLTPVYPVSTTSVPERTTVIACETRRALPTKIKKFRLLPNLWRFVSRQSLASANATHPHTFVRAPHRHPRDGAPRCTCPPRSCSVASATSTGAPRRSHHSATQARQAPDSIQHHSHLRRQNPQTPTTTCLSAIRPRARISLLHSAGHMVIFPAALQEPLDDRPHTSPGTFIYLMHVSTPGWPTQQRRPALRHPDGPKLPYCTGHILPALPCTLPRQCRGRVTNVLPCSVPDCSALPCPTSPTRSPSSFAVDLARPAQLPRQSSARRSADDACADLFLSNLQRRRADRPANLIDLLAHSRTARRCCRGPRGALAAARMPLSPRAQGLVKVLGREERERAGARPEAVPAD